MEIIRDYNAFILGRMCKAFIQAFAAQNWKVTCAGRTLLARYAAWLGARGYASHPNVEQGMALLRMWQAARTIQVRFRALCAKRKDAAFRRSLARLCYQLGHSPQIAEAIYLRACG